MTVGHPGEIAPSGVDDRLMTALSTEFFTLQGARSATVSESNGRLAVFLSTVSSFVVALAFVGQISGLGEPFFAFALVLLPALLFLGTVTYVRVLQSGIEDLMLTCAMNRIRHYFVEIDPGAARYFMLSIHDDAMGHMSNLGFAPGKRQIYYTAATAVLVVNALIAGVLAAVSTMAIWQVSLHIAAVVGLVAGIGAGGAYFTHQWREWVRAERAVPSQFPSASGPPGR